MRWSLTGHIANLSALSCLSSRGPERGNSKRRREVAAWVAVEDNSW